MRGAGIAVSIGFHSADRLTVQCHIKLNALDLYIVDHIILVDLDLQLIGLVLYLIAVIAQLGIGECVCIIHNAVAAVDLVIGVVKHIAVGSSDLLSLSHFLTYSL